jgi:predicted dehydrogenase/nucleoside-diphosphate-sugar epimerase
MTRSSEAPTRVAVVGAGYIADFHLALLAGVPGVQLVAVCDVSEARARAAAQRFGVPHAVTELGELAELGVDVAHLCVPPDLHVALTRELLTRGIGAFVEKPLALTEPEVAELEALAAARHLPLAVNHNNVFHPAFTRLCARLRAGEIGRIEHVQVDLAVPVAQLDSGDFSHWMFRAERNIVLEQAVHPLSQLHHLLGPVHELEARVLASRELNPGQIFREKWVASGAAERGTFDCYFHFGAPFTRCTLEVIGSDGALEADLFHDLLTGERKTPYLDFWNSYLAGARRARQLRRDARRVLRGWLGFTLGLSARQDAFWLGMQGSINAFHAALRAGVPLPSGAAAAREVAAWCDALAGDLPGEPPPPPAFPAPGAARPDEVVVLGANGFIGRGVVRELLARGAHVTCVVRRLHALPPEVVEPGLDGRVRVVRATLNDGQALHTALAGARTCLTLATGGGDSWDAIQENMVRGSVRVAEACKRADVQRLVYVSSIVALYNGPDAGVAEIKDDAPCDPRIDEREMYSRGKAYTERALETYCARERLSLVIARPGVVLGRGSAMQHTGLGLWVRDNHCVGWGLGEHAPALVWVDDVADGLARICLHDGDELDGKALNLAARVPLTAREVVEELGRHTGRKLHFHPRALWKSQLMEIGKWLVKKAGRRPGVTFPAYRDLKARSQAQPYAADLARGVLGWSPLEDREEFLNRAVRVHRDAPRRPDAARGAPAPLLAGASEPEGEEATAGR